jgi:hypothetical protein
VILTAIVTPSTLNDVLSDITPPEMRTVSILDGAPGESVVSCIGADVPIDKLLKFAQQTQASIDRREDKANWDRLVLRAHTRIGNWSVEGCIASLTIWVDHDSGGAL